MTEEEHKTTESLIDIESKFNVFVEKYKEFCIDKILAPESDTFTDKMSSSSDIIDNFVKFEIKSDSVDSSCLNELNDVSEIIAKLFESEVTFMKAMKSDIAEFNKLYNCWKYGNIDDPGVMPSKLQQNSSSGDGGRR